MRGVTRLFATVCVAASCAIGLAQEVGVPVDREPRHHVVFTNAAVRVIDARIAVGDVTLFHTHAADNVPVCIRGGLMTVQPLGGTPQAVTARTGDASLAAGGYTHQIANAGPAPLHFVDVEIHAAAPAGAPANAPVPPGHELVLDAPRVRVLRHRVGAGPAADVHARPLLAVVVPPGHDRAADGPAGAPAPGAYRWRKAGSAARPLPAGTEVVEIEIKGTSG
jgi:hypothetical protein